MIGLTIKYRGLTFQTHVLDRTVTAGRLAPLLVLAAIASQVPVKRAIAAPQQTTQPTTIIVIPFETKSRTGADFGKRLADELRNRLAQTPGYESVDWADLRASLSRLGVKESAAVDPTCILGRQLAVHANIDIVICGTYQAINDDEYLVVANVIAPEDGSQSLIGPVRTVRPEEAANAIVAQLAERVPDGAADHSLASYVDASVDHCRITEDHVAALGDEISGTISYPLTVGRDALSRYFVVGAAEQTSVLVFGPQGEFQRRLGRAGAGPGEFGAIHLIHRWLGDSIAVWDGINRRFQIYPLTLGEPRLHRATIVPRRAAVLEDGTLVVNAQIRTTAQAGFALHVIGSDGTIENSFDGTNSFRFDRPHVARRSVAQSALGGVWTGPQTEYRLRRFSPAGEILQEIVRDVAWFKGGSSYGPQRGRPDQPPNPGLIDIIEDNQTRIWTMVHVADADWPSGLAERPGMYGRMSTVVVDEQSYWDTVLEVLDPASRTVIASRRIDPAMLGWLEPGYAYSYREDDVGFPYIDVWRINLIC